VKPEQVFFAWSANREPSDAGLSIVAGISMLLLLPNQKYLQFPKELPESGKLRPVIDRSYQLRETAKADRQVEEGHARGKVVITMGVRTPPRKVL
jgi:Zinc-binding dehydrogenase